MTVAGPALVLIVACAATLGCLDGRDRGRDIALPEGPFAVADSLRIVGRYAEALPHFRALRDSLGGSADSALRWRAETGWAEMLLRTGRLDSARVALDDAWRLAGGDRRREARTYYVRGLLLHRLGRLDSALVVAAASLAGARAERDDALTVDAQSLHATVHSLSGRYRLAAAYAESALVGERPLRRSRQFLAVRLNNLGVEYRHLGRLTEAERVLGEALELGRTLPAPRVTMLASGNMASLRRMTGQNAEALIFAEQVTRMGDSLRDVQGTIVGLDDVGDTHFATGNLTAARTAFERSLAANTPTRNAYGRIVAQLGVGRVEIAEGHFALALPPLSAARALADSGSFGQERVLSRTRLAEATLGRGQPMAALRWAAAAVQLSDSVGDLGAALEAIAMRATVLEALGRTADGAAGYLAAIELLESSRGRLALGDLRMGVAEPYWRVYEGAIRTLLRRGDAAAAFAVAERAKARLLLELMAERDASRVGASPANALKDGLRVLAEERTGARTATRRTELDGEIAVAIAALTEIERVERASDPAGAARFPTPAPLSALREGLLAPGHALVTYFWGERDVYGWSLAGDSIRAARLGRADSIGAQVEFLRAALESPNSVEWTGPARRAWLTLLSPLSIPPSDDLLIVPDGALAQLPFEALIAAGDSQPLAATHRVSYGPSASVLLALARRRTDDSWPKALLAVGNPVAASLPHAEREAREVYALFQPVGADLLVGRGATRERWLALGPSRYRYLHFAAHAEVNDRQPGRTRVLLTGGSLDLAAIRQLELRSDLVTLSACETALGRRVRGEGIIGLPHAFLAAGAEAVLVTLWRVDDRATALFMAEFYREVRAGSSPAAALLSVRSRWVARRPGVHPAFWAPFVLVGG